MGAPPRPSRRLLGGQTLTLVRRARPAAIHWRGAFMKRSVTHATFVIERSYDAAPAAVFDAWSDVKAKSRWFGGPDDWGPDEHTLDFRIGGREVSRGGPKGGPVHTYDARYWDIVPNERIIIAYDMHLDDRRISVSLATVEFRPEGKG